MNPKVERPGYDRARLETGIVHMGLGAFARAHLAAYVEACLPDDPRWGIAGVSLRSPDTHDALAPQDGLYGLGIQSSDGLKAQVIGALTQVVLAPEEPEKLAALLMAPTTRIVSLTITEKGYCHDPASGRLNQAHPDIVHDLGDVPYPRSAIGWIAHGLLARRASEIAPFAVLSCDNLPSNGRTLAGVVLEFLGLKAPEAAAWARDQVAFPSSMVDRIVPATTDASRAQMADALGLEDAWPVMSEPFSQFVVEDRFPLGRPDWQCHGVTIAQDVEPFERMKLRMLNGSHSTLAYLGCLAGDTHVADTMADPAFKRLIHDLMTHEIMPTLSMPPGVDLPGYRDALLARFSNSALAHRTSQIAMDGSQKLPQRLLGTIGDRLQAGQGVTLLALGVAAWMRYASGRDEQGRPVDVRDPLSAEMLAIGRAHGRNAQSLAQAMLALTTVFGEDLPASRVFVLAVTEQLDRLMAIGARATIAHNAQRSTG